MSIELKAFLFSLPLAFGMYAVLIVAGFLLWGGNWNMSGLPVVSLITGFVAYRIVKQHLEQRIKSK